MNGRNHGSIKRVAFRMEIKLCEASNLMKDLSAIVSDSQNLTTGMHVPQHVV